MEVFDSQMIFGQMRPQNPHLEFIWGPTIYSAYKINDIYRQLD